jgi:catechol 2,3-dioxygenase-like lactoylglutathione lyase family enzyme
VKRVLATIAAALLVIAPARAQAPALGVESVGLTVSDLDRSVALFRDVLSFEVAGMEEHEGAAHEALEGVFGLHTRVARMRLGGESLELTQYLAPEGRPIPLDSRSNDRWFQHVALIVSDMDRAYAVLREHHVRFASSSPQRLPDWNPNAGGIQAFYFKDEDGHVLEVLAFSADKGAAKWHELAKSGRLFLGIDHTAIVVEDTERSLAFYRDVLGLAVAGASENWGTEQEHLNNVFGAHLRITSLRGPSGPGVEFLEYLAPSDGRPYPLDARGNDLAHWETRVAVSALEGWEARLRSARAPFVSSRAVELEGGAGALLVRDPDGHAVELRLAAAHQ